jgi:hypothetical protein
MIISSQGTTFSMQTAMGAPSAPVTAATKAAPVVLTFTTLPVGLNAGDVVIPQGFGWKSIDGSPFQVDIDSVAKTVTLLESDASKEASAATLGTITPVTMSETCVTGWTLTEPAGTTIDTTTLCDTVRQIIGGLPGIPTWQVTGFWDSQDPMQKTMRDVYKSGKTVVFECRFNDGSGVLYLGTVNTYDIRVALDQAIAYTAGGQVSGGVTDIPFDASYVATEAGPVTTLSTPVAAPAQAA